MNSRDKADTIIVFGFIAIPLLFGLGFMLNMEHNTTQLRKECIAARGKWNGEDCHFPKCSEASK